MEIQFWGVRGSLPTPGPDTAQFGGNTACVEIRCKDEPLIILDAGTGIRKLGMEIAQDSSVSEIYLLLSHTHWDHIQGMPFFSPLFNPAYTIHMYGPSHYSKNLQEILSLQMEYTYFPVRVEELAANISFNDITECQFTIGKNTKVTTKFVNHPVVCLAYRIENEGKVFTYLTDHEPYRNLFEDSDEANREEGSIVAQEQNAALIEFIKGSDLLCVDAQYTPEEYKTHVGWGHSSVDDSYELAREGHVREMIIFHHDPDRTDAELQKILSGLQDRSWTPHSEAVPVRLARERQLITI